VSPRADTDAVEKRKILPLPESNPGDPGRSQSPYRQRWCNNLNPNIVDRGPLGEGVAIHNFRNYATGLYYSFTVLIYAVMYMIYCDARKPE
jgi:hypothetical protein